MPLTVETLLDALLDSWDRSNTILVNLLRALPEGGMDVRVTPDSPTAGALFAHIHYCRLVFTEEDAPEFARAVPTGEWQHEHDRTRLAVMLTESAATVREAVAGRLAAGRDMDQHYDHPILFLQHMIWHEGYHHGQIKAALKGAGLAVDDAAVGSVTWGVWMRKAGARR